MYNSPPPLSHLPNILHPNLKFIYFDGPDTMGLARQLILSPNNTTIMSIKWPPHASCQRSHFLLEMVQIWEKQQCWTFMWVCIIIFLSYKFGARREGEEQRREKENGEVKNKRWQRDGCSGAVVERSRCWAGLGGTVWHTALCWGEWEHIFTKTNLILYIFSHFSGRETVYHAMPNTWYSVSY